MENSNIDKTDDQADQNQETEKVTLSQEDYKKLVGDQKSYRDSQKEAQNLHLENSFYKDNKQFYKVYDSNRKLADKIAKDNGYGDAGELKEFLDGHYGKKETKTINVEDKVNEALNKRESERSVKDFFKSK